MWGNRTVAAPAYDVFFPRYFSLAACSKQCIIQCIRVENACSKKNDTLALHTGSTHLGGYFNCEPTFNVDTVKYIHFSPPSVSFFPLDRPVYKFVMRTILHIMTNGQNNIKYSSKFSNSSNPSLKGSDPPRYSICGIDDTSKFHMCSANI